MSESDMTRLFPPLAEVSHLLVGTGHDDFLASRLAHAVEDADANLINMNVTSLSDPYNDHIIDLRIDHRDPERVARSLERYGYNILRLDAADGLDADHIRNRVNEIIRYLEI